MRRLFSSLVLAALCMQWVPLARAESGFYLVSAYYSPEEGQSFYLHGNYEDEIRVNGGGKTTASGASVRIGAIAAPKSIPFNTKISINQSITIKGKTYDFNYQGTVLDRGGAINTASKLPRLDIYMGSGQKGLCRALNFGVQTVYASFEDSGKADTTSMDFLPSDCSNPGTTPVTPPKTSASFDPFTSSLSTLTTAENIKTVQRLLQRVNALIGTVDGVYDQEFKDSVFAFQKAQGVVKTRDEEGAGVYGPRTRSQLRAVLQGDVAGATPPETTSDDSTTPPPTTSQDTSNASSGSLDDSSDSILTGDVFDGNKSEEIRDLQKMLKEMGYFKFEIDGLYNKRLVDAILEFQLAKQIVTSGDDIGAGFYGPVTQSTLEEAYTAYLAKKIKIDALKAELEKIKAARIAVAAEQKKIFETSIQKIPTLKLGQIHPEIRTLQKLLKEYGYLDHKDTAIFGPLTKNALARYQLDLKVIDSISSQYAGVLGVKTKQAIVEDMVNRWQKTYTADFEAVQKIENEIVELSK
ncbi:MAG: peptidoglycan-binding protein [Candidatus Gracilibacteria bacterium]